MEKREKEKVRKILESRLLEIYESLMDLRERVNKESKAYKEATTTMVEINKVIDVKSIRQKEVRVDSNALKFDGGKLDGKVILSDNEDVYELQIQDNEIKQCEVKEGGFEKLEWIVTQLESSRGDVVPKKS
ncbi:MAG: hypothetical protein ABIG39_07095 [Candidatus Micrarchaeota archaeon]